MKTKRFGAAKQNKLPENFLGHKKCREESKPTAISREKNPIKKQKPDDYLLIT